MKKAKNQTSQQPSYRKLNLVTMGGKGGTGKTTFMASLAEWFHANAIPVVLRDLDTENKTKGGLQHFYSDAEKINVHARGGLDSFFDTADINESVVLADMGAGQGDAAMRWFEEASDQAREFGIGFVFVGVINNDPASVTSVLQWGHILQKKVRYWVILNEMQDECSGFEYWYDSDSAREFCQVFDPIVTKLSSRLPLIQGHIADHGLSLGDIIEKRSGIVELTKSRYVGNAMRYRANLFREFDRIVPALLPEI